MLGIDSEYDIVIVGSGIVGATAALAFAKNTSLRIAVLEAKTPSFVWPMSFYEYKARVSAIALSSQRIFENIHVWPSIIAKRVSPYQKMQVWDPAGKGILSFTSEALSEN